MDIIFNRRSIRNFTSEKITDEQMHKLLKAAMRAPSAGNEQPWEFIAIRKRETMVGILEFHPYAATVKEADAVIVVCGNKNYSKFQHEYWIQDCSAATQNLLLEASYLGLGGVWLGIYPIEERVVAMQKLLGLPEEVIPLGAVALGYPAKVPDPIDTFKPERIHTEKW